jgi:AraC-like DNA-binding protein
VALRAELEARLAPVRPVADIAAALGYAPRTLSRACLAATGRTAKQLVDERVFLEARRLLVHTDSTVAGVGAALGFSEPTNFTKFFVRMSGRTPGAWRRG